MEVGKDAAGLTCLRLQGQLDASTAGSIWARAIQALPKEAAVAIVDATELDYCDGTGIALLLDLECIQRRQGGSLELRNLAPRFQGLLDSARSLEDLDQQRPGPRRMSWPEYVGQRSVELSRDLANLLTYVGHMTQALAFAFRHPRRVRWNDFLYTCTAAGTFALPVVCLIGFLIGWIMSFQAAHVMHDYGADSYLALLIGPSMVRELGPLMTTVVLAARSGSAFAAEIGTMKINEEVDALSTMGLDPVRFLVTPKVLAALVVTPLLTMFASLSGIIGGAIVSVQVLDLPLTVYIQRLQEVLSVTDLMGGLVKAMIFGILVAAIGCIRGLQTRQNALAVGESTTSAVVSGIVLIAITDGILVVIYRILDI